MARTKIVVTLLRALTLVGLASLFLALVLCTGGCTGARPDYVQAALVHQSHPGAGPGPWPAGGGEAETTINGIEGAAGWERGPWFADVALMYNLRERNLSGGPWTSTFRFGRRLRFGHRAVPAPPVGKGPAPDAFPLGPVVLPLAPETPDPWDRLNPRPKAR